MSTAKAISHTTYLIGVFLGSFHKVILATLFLSVSSFCAVHTFFSLVQYGNHVCLLYAESTATAHTHSSCFGPVTRISVCVHCSYTTIYRIGSFPLGYSQAKAVTFRMVCDVSFSSTHSLTHTHTHMRALRHSLFLSSEAIKNYWVSYSSTCFTIH